MSEARIAALVCEGQTDVPVLRGIIQELWPEIEEVRCLQPELDEMDRAKGPAGWTQVRAWCESHAGRLAEVIDPDVGDRIDLLLVAMDVDIAVAAGIANPPHGVGVYETTRLRSTMTQWLKPPGGSKLPAALILSSPVMAVEAWVIAALFPRQAKPENIKDPAQWLAEKGKLRRSPKHRKPWKELHVYQGFAATVVSKLGRVRKACVEAERTAAEIEKRRAGVAKR